MIEEDLSWVEESATKSTYKLCVGFERCEKKGEKSAVFLSAMRKSSNALVTFSDRICFECDEKGHYVNKCPQRRPKDQPSETGCPNECYTPRQLIFHSDHSLICFLFYSQNLRARFLLRG
jgi:hypothetical protein